MNTLSCKGAEFVITEVEQCLHEPVQPRYRARPKGLADPMGHRQGGQGADAGTPSRTVGTGSRKLVAYAYMYSYTRPDSTRPCNSTGERRRPQVEEIRTGDPNGEGALLWPRCDDATDQRLNFDAELSVISGFRRPECEFWWSVYDRQFE